jgi:hypothetical protein
MFAKDNLTFVKGNTFKTSRDGGGTKITASVGASAGGSMHASIFNASQYNYWMSGLLPATPDIPDSTTLAYFYRDIYLHDNVGGSCVDIMSVFPFSDWELRGLSEKELEPFNRALERLNLRELFPQISTAYLTDGFYCGSLVYDAQARNFMDILTHDALNCSITPSPFNNIDPSIRVSVSGPTAEFITATSEYAKRYIDTMPRAFVEMLKEGSFVLDPLTTLFIGRRTLTDRAYQSYLHRLLPMYLIEKTMYRGTLVEAQRRQRAMTHITAGDDLWTPTSEELRTLATMFQDAERDPLGGWITTRNGVQAQDVRPGGDFWKWTDMSDTLTPYKLRAIGTSEALLSGDSSYAAAESAYSTFLETCDGYRTHLTNSVFYRRIFPVVALANRLFKDAKAAAKAENVVEFLFNSTNRSNLKTPVVHWHKDLTGNSEDNLMELLEKLDEKEITVPIKMWLAAAGVDKDTLIRDARDDAEIREALNMAGLPKGGAQEPDPDEGEFYDEPGSEPSHASALPQVRSINSPYSRGWRKSIEGRDFSDAILSKSGKKSVYRPKSPAQKRDDNWQIAKIAASVEDPNTRRRLMKANQAKGVATLKGIL